MTETPHCDHDDDDDDDDGDDDGIHLTLSPNSKMSPFLGLFKGLETMFT